MKKEWITRTDAARLAKVSAATITNWSKSGLITVKVINRMMYVDKKTLTNLLESSLYEKTADLEELECQLDERIKEVKKEIKKAKDVTRFMRLGYGRYLHYKKLITSAIINNTRYYNEETDYSNISVLLENYLDFLSSIDERKTINGIKEIADSFGLTDDLLIRKIDRYVERLNDNNTLILCRLENLMKENLTKELELSKLRKICELKEKSVDDITTDEERRLKLLDTNIENLDLSVRSLNCLYYVNGDRVKTLGDLVKRTEKEIRSLRNFGHKSFNEVNDAIKRFGFCWDMDVDLYLITGEIKEKRG